MYRSSNSVVKLSLDNASFDVDFGQLFEISDSGSGGIVWPACTATDDSLMYRPHKFYIIRMALSDSISGKVHFYASGFIVGSGQ